MRHVAAVRIGWSRRANAFFSAVVAAYDALAEQERDRYVVLDGTDPPDVVLATALTVLKRLQ